MAILAVATVAYTYGSGNNPNRQIDFVRVGNPPALRARVTVIGGPQISEISSNQISVEMESTTEKASRYALERQDPQNAPQAKPNRTLSSFQAQQQDQIVQSINASPQATGGRWIEVVNGHVVNGHETIFKLTIIDPR